MKTILEYLVNNHVSNSIGSKDVYPEKIQDFMDDINKFINETIGPLGLHEEDRSDGVKNKDGWYLREHVFRKWFEDYGFNWNVLVNLIKKPIKEIATKYQLNCKIDRITSSNMFHTSGGEVILYKKNTSTRDYYFRLTLYPQDDSLKIFCAVNENSFLI